MKAAARVEQDGDMEGDGMNAVEMDCIGDDESGRSMMTMMMKIRIEQLFRRE